MQVFHYVVSARKQSWKEPLECKDDVIRPVRSVIDNNLGRIRGDQAVQEFWILLGANLNVHAVLSMRPAAGINVDTNNLRFRKKLRPHPNGGAVENPDLDQVQLCVTQCGEALLVMA